MILRGFLILIFSICWVYSIAQEKLIPEIDNSKNAFKKDTLQAVEITKQRDNIPLSTTVSGQQLSSKDIEKSNSLNVADALKGFSGVQIRDYGGMGGMKTIDVRNLGSKHTVVFYDGLAINDAQNGEIDLSKFSLDNLQSISLYNNNHQDIAQPAKAFASASALFLESRLPIFTEGKKVNIRARLSGGSFGSINPSFFIQQKLSKNTSFSLSTEWMKADGEYDFHYKNQALLDTVISRKNTDLETFRVESGFQGKLKDSSEWRLNGYLYLSERGLPGPALNNNYYAQDRQDDKNMFLQGTWNKKFSNFYQLKLNGKYSYNWMRYLDPNFQNSAGRLENFYTQKEIYLSAVNVFQFNDQLKASISTDYFNNQLDANLVSFAYPKRNTGLIILAMDYQNGIWRVQGNLLSTLVQDKVLLGSAAESKTAFSPSLSFSLKPFEKQILYLRGSYKSIFRLPTFNDSYYTLIGSTYLKPEYVKQFNVGLTFQKEFDGLVQSITFKTDAYHNNIKDRITAIPRSFRWTMINIGEVKIEGLEMGLQSRLEFTKDLHASLSINTTFQKGIDITSNGYYYGQEIPYSPRNSSSASASLHYRSWALSTNSLYSGAKYSGRENRPSYYLDEWFIQDLSLSYDFKLSSTQIKLLGEVNNIFNEDYVVMENYPMPGTNYRASIHINF